MEIFATFLSIAIPVIFLLFSILSPPVIKVPDFEENVPQTYIGTLY